MAMLISRATGNFTDAATWGVADSASGSQLTNPSASTNTTTSYVYSSAFTGTNTRVSDGIALFLKRLNTTGTVTVALSDDNGVTATREVTVNASDLPADESWVFFKFGSTLTLDGGTDYKVGVKASSADNALIYRNATAGNWARMVSTTLTGAPAAGDTMLIVGEWTGAGSSAAITVTMDNTATATDFGTGTTSGLPTQTSPGAYGGIQVGQNGVMTWGTTAATNYYLKLSGHFIVWSGGAYNMGTSTTPCPRDSTMTLLLDSTGATPTTSFCWFAANGAVVSIYGQSRSSGKNVVSCKLSANVSANATSLTVDTDTGWLDNDQIAVASTTQTSTQCELGALNGNAGASSLTVDSFAGTAGGLAFAHSGTSPTQAAVINVTRNVVIKGVSATSAIYTQIFNVAQCTMRWCRFEFYCGQTNTWSSSVNSIDAQYCAFFRGTGGSFLTISALTTFSNNVFWNEGGAGVTAVFNSGTTLNAQTIENNTLIYGSNTGISLTPVMNTVFNNNTVAGHSTGMNVGSLPSGANGTFTVSNCVFHANITGFTSFGTHRPNTAVELINCSAWRNVVGVQLGNNSTNLTNCTVFGNSTANVDFSSGNRPVTTMRNCTFSGDTSFSAPRGINNGNSASSGYVLNIISCSFSPTSGIFVPHTTADISLPVATSGVRGYITMQNTTLACSTEVENPAAIVEGGFIKSSKHDGTEGAFKSWVPNGLIERDTTIFNTAAPSERLTPSSATFKLASGSRIVAVDDLGTVTINVYVRKSTAGDGSAYNGNQPRLILKANPAAGINADVVLDTMTVSTGSWEQLTGTTAAVDADGALEFYVDCDGTAGWINVDDWSVS